MTDHNLHAPAGYHYRGMKPISPKSKLCAYIPEEKAVQEWKDRYIHLWTHDPIEDIKELNGKKVPSARCTICDKKLVMSFTTGEKLSLTNMMKHVREKHITELSSSDQKNKEVNFI
jgi:hypothetical protein